MRKWIPLTLAVLLLPLSGCNKLSFKEFSSPEGKFSVLMPGNPDKKTQSVEGLTVVGYGVEVRNGAFAVFYADIPPGRPFNLSGGIKGAVAPYGGSVLSEKDYTFEGATGKEFEADAKNPKGYLSGRMFVINNRWYQVVAMGGNARLSNSDVQTFLNSFKLLK